MSKLFIKILVCSSLAHFYACNKSDFKTTSNNEPQLKETEPDPIAPSENQEQNPLPVCRTGPDFQGANFIFLIDNSGSMLETDCPTLRPSSSADFESNCDVTQRETSILNIFDILAKASQENKFSEKSMSSVSVAKFTPELRDATIDEFDSQQLTVASRPEKRDSLSSQLKFARQPYGDTPFLNALQLAKRILTSSDLLPDKENVIVLLTDGDPTDRSPAGVLKTASEINAKIMTVRITPEIIGRQERLDRHIERMEAYGGELWPIDTYSNLEEYVSDLIDLAKNFSSEPVIDIDAAEVLTKNIFEKVIQRNIDCLPEEK